ncbi:12525_t:CDS:2 [Acaulospora morrowiae]|uniref:12525_t:CDS:1 n=1 Tax=Acaulospora morrowiae TaxID=94023 RepID=A0A9N9I4I8_9GLOM|nr:12525_t:CDS:2 [Acaulospora morrowiae]
MAFKHSTRVLRRTHPHTPFMDVMDNFPTTSEILSIIHDGQRNDHAITESIVKEQDEIERSSRSSNGETTDQSHSHSPITQQAFNAADDGDECVRRRRGKNTNDDHFKIRGVSTTSSGLGGIGKIPSNTNTFDGTDLSYGSIDKVK